MIPTHDSVNDLGYSAGAGPMLLLALITRFIANVSVKLTGWLRHLIARSGSKHRPCPHLACGKQERDTFVGYLASARHSDDERRNSVSQFVN